MRHRRFSGAGEKGQALLISVVVMVLCLFGALVVTHLSRLASEQSHVQSIADATALAGATGHREAAQSVAERNGAYLDSFQRLDDRVKVEVSLDGITASATAEVGIDQTGGPSE